MEIIIVAIAIVIILFIRILFGTSKNDTPNIPVDEYTALQNRQLTRKEFYHEYLKTDAWKRKRYLVLKRDGYKCVYCGAQASEVHHLKYARNIGKEPIEWLVSICRECHEKQHQ